MGAFFAGACGAILMAVVAIGQYQVESGLIAGVISDPSGLPLHGARVVIASSDGGVQPRAVVTDENGNYRFSDVSAARYRVMAQMPGFLTKPTEIVLEPGERVEWGGALLLGSVSHNRSVEDLVLDFTGPNSMDCGRHIGDSVDDATLRRALECGVRAAHGRRPFSLVVQYSTGTQWAFEGLVATLDGEVRAFTHSSAKGDLETSPCPRPAILLHAAASKQRIACDSRRLTV